MQPYLASTISFKFLYVGDQTHQITLDVEQHGLYKSLSWVPNRKQELVNACSHFYCPSDLYWQSSPYSLNFRNVDKLRLSLLSEEKENFPY